MKQKLQKQHVGVWLDNQHAIIITNGAEQDYSILNKVKVTEHQGSGSEHSMNNSKQTESLKYFKSLSTQLMPYDEILLFGPGKSQEQFQHHLKKDVQFNSKQISIDSSGDLTDPQMIAMVRDFFKGR
jgi:stalled ribosome rescue protein Dom34